MYVYDAFQKQLPSCRLFRSPSNLLRRKSINFYLVPRRSRKFSWKLSEKTKEEEKTNIIKVDMTAAQEAPGSFLEATRKFHEEKRKSKFIKCAVWNTAKEYVPRLRWKISWKISKSSRKCSGSFLEAFRKQNRTRGPLAHAAPWRL